MADKNLAECAPEDIADFHMWLEDGGITTARQYIHLEPEKRETINDFLENAKGYAVIENARKKYVLVHAGISGFEEGKPLEEYDIINFIDRRADYSRRYYSDRDTFVITGHTPTFSFRKDHRPEIYIGNGHIAIDCGCVYGGKLAAYAIETGNTVYVNGLDT